MRHPFRLALLAVAMLGPLAGCALLDQTSFGGQPRRPAPDTLTSALASHGASPLLVVRPDDGVPYGDALRAAIASAEQRGGTVSFRLESVVPATGDLQSQQAALDANAASARQVMEDMGSAGVAPDRVVLAARTDGQVLRAELRLYQS